VANRIGGPCQKSHHVVDTDVAPHGASALGAAQELSQDISECSDGRRLSELQVDSVVSKRFDEIALESAFACQALDEGRERTSGIPIV
jgi:hypothetical protein